MLPTFFKPIGQKLYKALASRERQKEKARKARHAKLAKSLEMDALRRDAYKRDGGRCRVCQMPLRLFSDDLLSRAQLHHILYRSRGGEDSLSNTVIICASCHDQEHRHIISIDGDAEELLTITVRDKDTGIVTDVRRSPCPA